MYYVYFVDPIDLLVYSSNPYRGSRKKDSIIYILYRDIPFLMKCTACHSMTSCMYFCGFPLVIVPSAVLVIDENQSNTDGTDNKRQENVNRVPLALDVALSG